MTAVSAASMGWRGVLALPFLGLQLAWLLSPQPIAVKAAPLLMLACALWRPAGALVVVAGLAPVAELFGGWLGGPFAGVRLYEQLAIAVVAAGLLRPAAVTGSRLAMPGGLFIAVAVVSALVVTPTWFLMQGLRPGPADLWVQVRAGDLFAIAGPWQPAHAALLIGLGVLLALTAERTLRARPEASRSVLLALAVGGAVAALFNLNHLVAAAARRDTGLLTAFVDLLGSARLSTQLDFNAAGSVFALLILASGTLWRGPVRTRWAAGLAMAIMAVGGLWLSGSRTAMAGALAGFLAALASIAWSHPAHRRRAIAGLAATGMLGALAVAAYPQTRNFALAGSVESRWILYGTALDMWRDAPITGMGVGTFHTRSTDYGSAAVDAILKTGRTRENAHNYFLQVLAELGLVGLLAFVWILGSVVWRIPSNETRWLIAAIAAFMATSLTGHPLLVAGAAFPFWLVMGCAAGATTPPGRGGARWRAWAAAAVLAVLLASIPLRMRATRDSAALEHVGLGVSLWQTDEDGDRYRVGDSESSLFVPTGSAIVLPVRLRAPAAAMVDVWIDGALVNRLEVGPDDWTELRLSIRPARRRFVELRLTAPAGATFLLGKVDAKPLSGDLSPSDAAHPEPRTP